VKGKAEPLHLWRAQRVIAGVSGVQQGEEGLEAPFVGREAELRLLKELFHASVDRSSARLVAVSGAAGVGKTRLRWEFVKYIDGLMDLMLWHSGRCLSYGDGVAYWALAEMVRQRFGIAEEASAEEASAKLSAGLERWIADPAEREFLAPRIGALIGVHEAGLSRQELFAGWRLFFERLSEHEPVIMAFEDLQWADDGLLDFLEHLLDWSAQKPIFILTLARPELADRRRGWPPARAGVTPVFLEPLPSETVAALLDELVDGLPAGASERIVSQAEGIPLYALETVRALVDRGVLAESNGHLVVTGDVGELEVPATLSSLLTARLDGLEPEERALVKELAVMGGSFSRGTVGAVSDVPEERLDVLLSALVRKQVLVVRADRFSPDSGQYAFSQALPRNVAYDMLSRHERKARHLAIAAHLRASFPNDGEEVAEVVAAHYLDAYRAAQDDPDAPELRAQAREALRRAARRAEKVGAPDAAERAYRTALDLADSEDDRIGMTEAAGLMALRAGRYEDSIELFETAAKALEIAGREREAARLVVHIGRAMAYSGRDKEAVARMTAALEVLGSDELDPDVAALNAGVASVLTFEGNTQDAVAPLERALQAAASLGLPALLCDAFINRGVLCAFTGRTDEGLVLFDGAIKVAERNDLTWQRARAELNAADICLRGGLPESVERAEASLDLIRQLGDRGLEVVSAGNVMLAWLLVGRWDDVDALAREHLAMSEQGGPTPEYVTNRLVTLLVLRGDMEAAREHFGKLVEWKDRLNYEGLKLHEATAGALMLADGRAAEAFEVLSKMIRDALEVEGPTSEGIRMGFPEAMDAAVQLGRLQEGAELCELFEVLPVGAVGPFMRAQLARGRGMLAAAGGDGDTVENHFLTAIGGFTKLGYPYWLARAQTELARWLIDQGRGAEAVLLLDDAIPAFESLGAAPTLARAMQLRHGQASVREAIGA
jgi:tetratricopeptide (TPR) repeat protein